ncbi:hypothetical protein TNCV_3343741 [Trichonephila clavipes]|nr:hypothetical protein TNCV_3343741 [Trichonephila clavipes]
MKHCDNFKSYLRFRIKDQSLDTVVPETTVGEIVWKGGSALVGLMYFRGEGCLTPEYTVKRRKGPWWFLQREAQNCFGSEEMGFSRDYPMSFREIGQRVGRNQAAVIRSCHH